MRRLTLLLPVLALAAQGCIIYNEACEGCGWRGGFEDRDDAWWGDDSDSDLNEDSEEAPVYHAALDPSQAIPGETLAARLYLDGDIHAGEVASVRFDRGVTVMFTEVGQDSVLLLLDVAIDAPLGPVDLHVGREDGSSVVFPDLLLLAEPAPPADDEECG